jgi:hypothetical protein
MVEGSTELIGPTTRRHSRTSTQEPSAAEPTAVGGRRGASEIATFSVSRCGKNFAPLTSVSGLPINGDFGHIIDLIKG